MRMRNNFDVVLLWVFLLLKIINHLTKYEFNICAVFACIFTIQVPGNEKRIFITTKSELKISYQVLFPELKEATNGILTVPVYFTVDT